MSNHPNATAAGATSLLTLAAIWVAAKCGYTLSEYWATFAAGVAVTAVLAVGRAGVWPTLQRIWNGASKAVTGPASKTATK